MLNCRSALLASLVVTAGFSQYVLALQQSEAWAPRVQQMELRGEARTAREEMDRALASDPGNVELLAARASFLDARRDPGARSAYEQLLKAGNLSTEQRREAIRRLPARLPGFRWRRSRFQGRSAASPAWRLCRRISMPLISSPLWPEMW
jgi:hypothetical protein